MSAPALDIQSLLFSLVGRIPRRVYWGTTIVMGVLNFVINFLIGMVLGGESSAMTASVIVGLLIFVIWIPVAVKRCHDRDKPGWWVMVALIPCAGWIWAFVELGCLRGTVGPNNFGQDPT